ncbi:hypothetical protein Tco_1153228, partial [Tanacetum coccineum]
AKNSMNHMVLSLAPKFTKLRALILSQDKPQLDDNAVETIANIVMIYMTSWLLGFVDVEKRHLTRPLSSVVAGWYTNCMEHDQKTCCIGSTDGKIKRSIRGVRTVKPIQKVWFIAQVIGDISFWINAATMVVLDENFIKVEFAAASREGTTSGSLSQRKATYY